jgi:hypothetical protein
VLVAQNHPGAVEDAPDSRLELPSDFGLGSPRGAQHRRDIHGGDLMDGAIEQRAGVSRAEMALPLIPDFRVHRLPLRVLDDELGDLLECRNGLGGLLGGSVGLDGVDPAGDESPRLQGPVASVLEADCGIRAETLVLADPIDLVAQDPFLAPSLTHDEVEAVAVTMPAWLCRLHSPFRKPRHSQSHIGSHTSARIVAHSDGQRKTSPHVSHRICL